MIALATISTLLFVVVGAVVGIRLLLLARRTRALPETFLGAGLSLIVMIGYPLSIVANQLGAASSIGRATSAISFVSLCLGWAFIWQFCWRVFRRDSPWVARLTWLGMAVIAILALLHLRWLYMVGGPEIRADSVASLGIQAVALGVYVWKGVESFAYWLRMRRRLALGAADPVVTNRFLLLGLLATFSFLSVIGPAVGSVTGGDPHKEPAILLLTSVGGFGGATALYLAFMAPAPYRLRLMRGASR